MDWGSLKGDMPKKDRKKSGGGFKDFDFSGLTSDGSDIRLEKAKARELRQSRWWKNIVAQGLCHYCGKKVPPQELTMDHMVPLALGGKTEKTNVVPCCKDCNTRKKDSLGFDWSPDQNPEE